MDKQLFFKTLSGIDSAKKVFETLESLSFNSIEPYVKLFGLPMEPHSYNYVHKLRAHLQNAISYHYGVKHLGGVKYPALAEKELFICKELTKNLLAFDVEQYSKMYSFLFNADPA